MAGATARQFCEHLARIVGLLEKGDSRGAAAAAVELEGFMADGPSSGSENDVAEARKLLARFRELGDGMQQVLLADMHRMGAAQRLRAYAQPGRRP